MTDSNAFECRDCGGPLRYGLLGFRCLNASGLDTDGHHTVHCGNAKRTRPKELNMAVYKCLRCRTMVKAPAGGDRPTCTKTWTIGQAEHACDGDLMFVKLQSR